MIAVRWCRTCDHPFVGDETHCGDCRQGWLTPKAAFRMRRREAAYAERMVARQPPGDHGGAPS